MHTFKLCLLRVAQTVNIDLCWYNRKRTESTLIDVKNVLQYYVKCYMEYECV